MEVEAKNGGYHTFAAPLEAIIIAPPGIINSVGRHLRCFKAPVEVARIKKHHDDITSIESKPKHKGKYTCVVIEEYGGLIAMGVSAACYWY